MKKRGVALLWVLILSTVLLIIMGAITSIIIKESQSSIKFEDSVKAYSAARSGIDWALVASPSPGSYQVNVEVVSGVPVTKAEVVVTTDQAVISTGCQLSGVSCSVERRLEYKVTSAAVPAVAYPLKLDQKMASLERSRFLDSRDSSGNTAVADLASQDNFDFSFNFNARADSSGVYFIDLMDNLAIGVDNRTDPSSSKSRIGFEFDSYSPNSGYTCSKWANVRLVVKDGLAPRQTSYLKSNQTTRVISNSCLVGYGLPADSISLWPGGTVEDIYAAWAKNPYRYKGVIKYNKAQGTVIGELYEFDRFSLKYTLIANTQINLTPGAALSGGPLDSPWFGTDTGALGVSNYFLKGVSDTGPTIDRVFLGLNNDFVYTCYPTYSGAGGYERGDYAYPRITGGTCGAFSLPPYIWTGASCAYDPYNGGRVLMDTGGLCTATQEPDSWNYNRVYLYARVLPAEAATPTIGGWVNNQGYIGADSPFKSIVLGYNNVKPGYKFSSYSGGCDSSPYGGLLLYTGLSHVTCTMNFTKIDLTVNSLSIKKSTTAGSVVINMAAASTAGGNISYDVAYGLYDNMLDDVRRTTGTFTSGNSASITQSSYNNGPVVLSDNSGNIKTYFCPSPATTTYVACAETPLKIYMVGIKANTTSTVQFFFYASSNNSGGISYNITRDSSNMTGSFTNGGTINITGGVYRIGDYNNGPVIIADSAGNTRTYRCPAPSPYTNVYVPCTLQ